MLRNLILITAIAASNVGCVCVGTNCTAGPGGGKPDYSGDGNGDGTNTSSQETDQSLEYVHCSDGTTSAYVDIDQSRIFTCFSEQYNGTYQFEANTPALVGRWCNPGLSSGTCRIYVGEDCDVDVTPLFGGLQCPTTNDCSQAGSAFTDDGGYTYYDLAGYCKWDATSCMTAATSAYTLLLSDMNAGKLSSPPCNTTDFTSAGILLTTLPADAYSYCNGSCTSDSSARLMRRQTEYELVVNPVSSYARGTTTAGGSLQRAVQGTIDLKASTHTFIGGKIWVASGGTLGSWVLSGWRAYFDGPMAYTTSGTAFTVTSTQALAAQAAVKGVSNSATTSSWAEPNHNITGHLNMGTMTWDADYAQTYASGYVTITTHLQGTIVPKAF